MPVSGNAPSSWPRWTPSAPAAVHQVGAVVEDERHAELVGGGAELLGRAHDAVVVERAVAQLDHVDPAGERPAQELTRPRVADQIQPPVHGGQCRSYHRRHTGARERTG